MPSERSTIEHNIEDIDGKRTLGKWLLSTRGLRKNGLAFGDLPRKVSLCRMAGRLSQRETYGLPSKPNTLLGIKDRSLEIY
jgi:hypothetical protein